MSSLFEIPYINTIWSVSFSVWLISHNIMPSRFIHVVTKKRYYFHSYNWKYSIVYTYVCVCAKSLQSGPLSRQEYWSGLLCPPPGDLPNPGIEPVSLMSHALPGGFFITSATWEVHIYIFFILSSIDSYLGCLLILAIVNNMEVWISHWCPVFLSSEYISRSGIAGWYGCSSFNFLRNLCIAFCNVSTNLHFHQQCTE